MHIFWRWTSFFVESTVSVSVHKLYNSFKLIYLCHVLVSARAELAILETVLIIVLPISTYVALLVVVLFKPYWTYIWYDNVLLDSKYSWQWLKQSF